jgi:hypothetical protein
VTEDPDFVVNLGDTTGIGANYKWEGLGLPTKNLTDEDYNNISKVLWLRMRKMYSAITPSIPFYIAFGNHDGEEKWNSLRFRAKEWRQKLFAFPDSSTYPEGGHPDGQYYGFTWGADAHNRGGAQFLFLDVCGFCERVPRTADEWTLGDDQLRWLESVLKKGEKEFVFACFHHVLGGWPAGPGEERTDIAYGRGPLFTAADYKNFIDPARIEQVRLTDLGKKYGLNAFMYGHDHIFHVHDIGKGDTGKDLLGVCVGTSKYVGEDVWWKGPLWMKYYGDAFKSKPDFWGPSGVTRLTIQNHALKLDYIVTGTTPYSNISYGERFGTVLDTRTVVSPLPSLKIDRTSLEFRGVEGAANPEPLVLGVQNAGSRAMSYALNSDRSWLSASPGTGTSWGESDAISVSVNISGMEEGSYTGSVTVESPGTAGSPQKADVVLKIDPPPIYPPLNFAGVRRINRGLFWRERLIVLTWENNPLNKNIQKYRLSVLEAAGSYGPVAEISGENLRYSVRNAQPNRPYSFALTAVDSKNREGEPAFVTIP